jgi:catechol 2,3-dioxygenase-like lactoylglutathione lyase family enzyme
VSGRSKLTSSSLLFVVSDLTRSVDFYVRKLGFQDPSLWGEPPCFAIIHRDGVEIMLSLAEDPAHVTPNGPNGVWDAYFRTKDIGGEHEALAAGGVEIARKPRQTVYDMIEMEIVDPDGYRICFGQNTR